MDHTWSFRRFVPNTVVENRRSEYRKTRLCTNRWFFFLRFKVMKVCWYLHICSYWLLGQQNSKNRKVGGKRGLNVEWMLREEQLKSSQFVRAFGADLHSRSSAAHQACLVSLHVYASIPWRDEVEPKCQPWLYPTSLTCRRSVPERYDHITSAQRRGWIDLSFLINLF